MAQILDIVTVGEKVVYSVDVDPSAGVGTPAPIGSLAFVNTGENYIKVGALDTAWDLVATATSGTNVKEGDFKRLAIYDTDASGYSVDDQIDQNGQLIDVIIEDQPSRTEDITYTIPNPGDAVTNANFVLTEGDQSINGDKTFNNDVTIQGNLDVNGTLTSIDTDNLTVEDKLITLNKNGIADSAGESGIEFEEDGSITAYIKTSTDREKFCFNAPAIDFDACLDFDKLTANRDFHFPDEAGSLVVQPTTQTGVAKQIAFWTSLNQISNETGVDENSFTWDDVNNLLGIQTASPQAIIHLFNQAITGTVDTTAVILGKAKLDANVGAGASILGGSSGVNEASGVDSHAQGTSSVASGDFSHAEGEGNTASGTAAHAEGEGTTASGAYSHTEGNATLASGTAAHAEGDTTTASGASAHAEGLNTEASGDRAHAEGNATTASGESAHAEGSGSVASGIASHAENASTASGDYSHAEGGNTTASGLTSHAEGNVTTSSGYGSHAEGQETLASNFAAHAEGYQTEASGSQAHAEGNATTASGESAHAEGSATTASGIGSHAEGSTTTASGEYSHAEGNGTTSSGNGSHSEGIDTVASGNGAHAEGDGAEATGDGAHAQGYQTTASGIYSHAQGSSTFASGENAHAQGFRSRAFGLNSTAIGTRAQTGANDGVTIITDSQDVESTAEVADSMKMRFQNGWDLVKGDGDDNSDGVNFRIRQASGNTTDGAAATIQTIAIPADSTVMIKSKIVGVRTGGTAGNVADSAAYEKTSVFKNIGGTVTVSKKQSDYTFEDQASWESNHDVSGTDAIISVTDKLCADCFTFSIINIRSYNG
jgi:hypothetical protein